MSAYLCNATHVGILAQFVSRRTSHWGNAGEVAKKLADENLRSVGYRYDETPDESAQSFLGMSAAEYIAQCQGAARATQVAIPLYRIFGMARCSNYQSCEHPEYETSEAKAILDYAQHKAAADYFEQQGLETGWEWSGK